MWRVERGGAKGRDVGVGGPMRELGWLERRTMMVIAVGLVTRLRIRVAGV